MLYSYTTIVILSHVENIYNSDLQYELSEAAMLQDSEPQEIEPESML